MKKVLTLVLILSLVLTGCGVGDQQSDVKEKTEMEKPFIASFPTDILTISPLGAVPASTKRVLRNMNEGIYKYSEDGSLNLGIAKDIEVSQEDGYIIFNIKLRDDVKFHNGKRLTSKDVKYSYERLSGQINGITLDMVPGGGNWKNLLNGDEEKGYKKGRIEIVDDYSLEVYVDNGYGILTSKHTLADGFLVPLDYSEEDQRKHPIGVGPYKFIENKEGDYIKFERFEEYYGEKPDIAKVEFHKYSDQSTLPLAFYSGEVDLLMLNNENYEKVKKDGYYISDSLSNDVRVLYMNQREGHIFENKDLRLAINHGIDKNKMLQSISNGRGAILNSHLTPFLKDYYNDELENYYEYDQEKAKDYLKKAGYEDGLEIKMRTVVENEMEQDIAALIIEDLDKIGIKVKNDAVPWNVFYEDVYTGHDYDLAILNVVGYPDPYRVLSRYRTGDSGNLAGFSNERYDEILKKIQTIDDKKLEIQYYKELQDLLAEDAVGVFTIDPGMSVAVGKDYEGYKNFPFAYVDISSIKRR